VDGDPTRGLTRKKLWELARDVVAPARPGDFNQALMELGAQVCSPSQPSCSECPLVGLCGAMKTSAQDRFPGSKASVQRRWQAVACAAVVRRGKVLLAQRPKKGLLGGMWELPGVDVERGDDGQKVLLDQLRGRVGVAAMKVGKELMKVEHQFTHIDMTYLAYSCEVKGRARAGQGYIAVAWVLPEELSRYGVGAATRKMLRRVFS